MSKQKVGGAGCVDIMHTYHNIQSQSKQLTPVFTLSGASEQTEMTQKSCPPVKLSSSALPKAKSTA